MKLSHADSADARVVATAPRVALRHVSKNYSTPAGTCPALRDVDLEVGAGEFVAIVGKSGSGKSTLLNVIGGIDRPSAGDVIVNGASVHSESESALARWRGKNVGIVFQFFQLLPTLTTAENVMLPMDFMNARPPRQRRGRALELLDLVGIADQADKLPSALSGGQQQRAAIARALANDPLIVIADEPTGNLDSATARDVLDLFRRLADAGTTVLIATHERDLSDVIDRRVEIADGTIVRQTPPESAR
ncbi:MAG: ABC transporter ATP-binding protein [Planctomycetes bacterium]|nr:ABC transporter ATP-binding protein [Planctomycetota bacterium]MBI3844702.1 ABC transporter ATP-binding protein [Planctomycetota bacterium]